MEKVIEFAKWLLIYSVLFYIILNVYLYFFADRMIFRPPISTYQDSDKIIKIKTGNNTVISAIYLKNDSANYTLLYSHGNAIDLGGMLPLLQILEQHNFSIFAYDYSGYGTSTGKPSEKNSYADITAAYNYLTQTLNISSRHIILYGKSLGAAPSIELATQKPVAGVILESPFISAFRTVTYWPIFPFDKFNNLNKIKNISSPLLIIHGEEDKTVPLWHGKMLFDLAKSKKINAWLPNIDHNDIPFYNEQYWRAVNQFLQQVNGSD